MRVAPSAAAMSVSGTGADAWRRRYGAHRKALLLRRIRWCVGLTMLGVMVAAAGVAVQSLPFRRLAFAFKFTAACLATWELTRTRSGRTHATALAVGYVGVMAALITATLRNLPAEAAVAPASFVGLMTGTALLLPWGAATQGLVCLLSLTAYGVLAVFQPAAAGSTAATSVIVALPVTMVGARMIEEYRATSFQRSWQQRQMMRLARDLAAAVEPAVVIGQVCEHARRLLAADSVSFSAFDAARHVFRVDALTTGGEPGRHWMEGLEIPEDFPVVREILARDVVAVPDDEPGAAVRALLDEHGARHVLYLTLRCGGELVGILALVRKTDIAFGRAERHLARALADQAALAMRTARLVADLRHANKLKSEFVSTMSHELRTPLTVILGFADMARDPGAGAEERDEFLRRIDAAGRDLLALIETTLEIGKMEAGRDEVQLEPVRLPEFWSVIGDACTRLPRAASVRLEWDDGVPGIALVTDPRKLTVIVRNLVGNALKFTEQGFVRADIRHEGEHVVLRVRDTGIGIRPEDHATVFEMFRQADGSLSRRYEGTGLGLYIVRRFVQQLGGTVELDSAPGRGSCFTVTLPCITDASPLERAA
jgi:signal transduction histidine kinase